MTMTELRNGATRVSIWCVLLISAACSSIQRDTPAPSGFLGDYTTLEPREGVNEPELFYADKSAEWKSYKKVLLDPVTIWQGRGHKIDVSADDAQRLANNLFRLVFQSLDHDFEMVTSPGPDTLRVQCAVTQVSTARVMLNVVASVVPELHAAGALESYVGMKPPFTGEGQLEMRILDAQSSAVLMETVDRRVGKRRLVGSWDSWRAVNDAMRFWSEQVRYLLCKQQGKPECPTPEEQSGS